MIRTQEAASYDVIPPSDKDAQEQIIIDQAIAILDSRLREPGEKLTSPSNVKNFLRIAIGNLEHEVFHMMAFDVQMRLIECVELARGTITSASVYPREVIKAALKLNAACVIFAHNHPSGAALPSAADDSITLKLKHLFDELDIKVRDHIIIGAKSSYSYAENWKI